MKCSRTPVVLFLLTVGVPFVLSVAFFMITQQRSLLTEPEVYIASLKRTGMASYMIPLSTWKHFLAHDPLCREAEADVIGSSRVREIDATVVGTSTCNLYVNGLGVPGFAHLAQELAPVAPGQHRVVYVGIDHFGLWYDTDHFDSVELKLLSTSRTLWKVWAVMRPLDFFTLGDLREAMQRYRQGHMRFEEEYSVWYPDGHMLHPRYYMQKRAGIHRSFSQQEIDQDVKENFEGQLHESNLRLLEQCVRLLHAKGYMVRVFWSPVNPAYIASARRQFPALFQQTIDAVDRLASTLPLDRYLSASQTLDPSRFGCAERDYIDQTHVDIDCMQRVFAIAFPHSKTM